MKSNMMKGAAIATALATMLAPAVVLAGKSGKASASVKCTGANDCKGKGSCKGASNDCKGQNACKGTGWKNEKSAAACEKSGGTVATAEKSDKTDAAPAK